VLIYPEGTRFTPEKRDKILASLAKKDPPAYQQARALKNLLPIHPGGPLALLEGNEGADVIFCAHVGLEGTMHLHDFLNGAVLGSTLRVRFWRVPFAEIPKSHDDRVAIRRPDRRGGQVDAGEQQLALAALDVEPPSVPMDDPVGARLPWS